MLDRVVRNWVKVGGASEAAIESLRRAAEFDLPTEYVELLRFSNGGEGPLRAPWGIFCLDDVETACSSAQATLYPGWFVFGGNGGLGLFAFDLTGGTPWPVVAFDGADPEGSTQRVADDFEAFLQLIGPGLELQATVDADGFVALVCPDMYSGYVAEDWTLDQVLARFTEQMNRASLFVAYPGADFSDQDLRIADAPLPTTALREVSGVVHVGEQGLWLTDYTQLTMAAQFREELPVRSHHARLPVGSGPHRITLRQFALSVGSASSPSIELIVTSVPGNQNTAHFGSVPWFR
ncbi:SMI1/KNR4 family protein [Burkholderia stagnalis]|uniref:SMI1/KNR4 family protein n=1 Tax=Burkholderia stagnalis TaxID=1503054 RepID=UPI000F56A9E3|nr:SMI1/KNR4 family protein [Burkholderia stagnalis]RQQ22481.1 SMI1/KNR4 family protein [Burkholderia stagnalis]RQQ24641.1 SMI1/KNR4 family protein [Burkholderia stagnalis]RQQ43316.1 SMI1/KNR4 family protein [Burkholderia stagnalis]RQY01189.1 SMI1/KNR4 family protein [Burkholderia stagnalis]RQY15608.1 SMI1/KNR4 family protein [Burkholderia stagnalis]